MKYQILGNILVTRVTRVTRGAKVTSGYLRVFPVSNPKVTTYFPKVTAENRMDKGK